VRRLKRTAKTRGGFDFLRMPLTTQPFAHAPELARPLDRVRSSLEQNVELPERIGSIAAGSALALYGLSRRSLGGALLALLGGSLIYRGSTGYCSLYRRLGINSRQMNDEVGVPGDKGIKVERSVQIARSPQEIYRFWRSLDNLPRFFEHVESVTPIDDLRSHWVVKGPAGTRLAWTAQILTDREGELISWESLPGAEVQNAGSVRFEPAGDERTNVTVKLQYYPPAGVIGAAVAKLFGESPDQQLDEDLSRLKQLLETNATVPSAV
jgi:uncharacterized membrane protein